MQVIFILQSHILRSFFKKLYNCILSYFISFSQIFVTSGGTNPSERSKTKLKNISHDILNIRWILKFMDSIIWFNISLGQWCLIQKAVSIIPEFHSFFWKFVDCFNLSDKWLFDETFEFFSISSNQMVWFFNWQSNWIISTSKWIMKGSLIRAKINNIFFLFCKSFP